MGLGQPRNCGSVPGRSKRLCCSPMVLGPTQPAFDLLLGRVCWWGVKRPAYEADHMTRLWIAMLQLYSSICLYGSWSLVQDYCVSYWWLTGNVQQTRHIITLPILWLVIKNEEYCQHWKTRKNSRFLNNVL